MKIVHYPHPALRHVSKEVKRVDADLRKIIAEMFELMYEAKGVGLAANQVALPLRFFVANLEADPAKGREQVFINPVITRRTGTDEKEEGCLSLPGLYGAVKRPDTIRVNAFNLRGEEIEADVAGMLARVIQHETDHLDGVLFTDRLTSTGKIEAREELEEFESEFRHRRSLGEIEDDEAIVARLREWEAKYC